MEIMKKFFTLLALKTHGNKEIEEEWEAMSATSNCQKEEIILCIHKKNGGLKKYGNYSLERKHSHNKGVLCDMTNKFKLGEAAASKCASGATPLCQHTCTRRSASTKEQRTIKPWVECTLCGFVPSTFFSFLYQHLRVSGH
jgi:hypothetical protein